MNIKLILLSIVILFVFSASKCGLGRKKTYSNLPADSASYMMLCDEINDDSTNAELFYKRGVYLTGKKQFIKALSDANKATSLDTTKAAYYMLLGDICYAVNKTKIAALSYERAIAIEKDNYAAYLKLGELYYIVKEHDASLKNYEEALRITPDCDVCYFYKGLNFMEMKTLEKNVDLALSMFQKTISINPGYYDAYIQLGEIFDKRNPKIALEYYNAALRLKPNSLEAMYHRAFNYQTNHNFDSAGADYKRIIDINPMFSDAYFNVAYMSMEQKKWQQAIEGFKLVVKINAANAGAWYNLGICYDKIGDKEKAAQALTQCLNYDPENKDAAKKLKQLK